MAENRQQEYVQESDAKYEEESKAGKEEEGDSSRSDGAKSEGKEEMENDAREANEVDNKEHADTTTAEAQDHGADEMGEIYEDNGYGDEEIFDMEPHELIQEGSTITKEVIYTLLPAGDGNDEESRPSLFETEILQRLFLAFCDKCVQYARELMTEDLDANRDAIFGLAEWAIQMLHDRRLYGPDCPNLSPKGSAFWAKVLAQGYNTIAEVERTKGFLHSTLRHMEKVLRYEGILLRNSKATAVHHETESKATPEEVICVDSCNIRIPTLPMFPRRCKVLAQSVRTHLNTASTISLLNRHDDAYRQAQVAVSFVLMFQSDPEQYNIPLDEEEAASWDLLFALLLGQAYYSVATELEFLQQLRDAKANYEFAKSSLNPLYKNRKVREPIEFLDGGIMDPREVYNDMRSLEHACDKAREDVDKTIALQEEGHQKRGETRQRGRVASRYAGRSTLKTETKPDSRKSRQSSRNTPGKANKKSSASNQSDEALKELMQQYPSFEEFDSKYTPPPCCHFFATDVENAVFNDIKARSGSTDGNALNKSQSLASNGSAEQPARIQALLQGHEGEADSKSVSKSWRAWDEFLEEAQQRYDHVCSLHPDGIPERDRMEFAKWLVKRISSATEHFDTSTRNKLNKVKAEAVGDERTASQSSGRETIFDEARESMSRKSGRR
eukprot:gb/GECG01014877.1/.p1 GENE.gb/GECG01014877.1/~~gb/GECG01014877.1/.p1  ORF type:complete len:670 (+),score=122.00 gb/GECG01014877.1/:1-2010(+)